MIKNIIAFLIVGGGALFLYYKMKIAIVFVISYIFLSSFLVMAYLFKDERVINSIKELNSKIDAYLINLKNEFERGRAPSQAINN